MLYWYSLRLPVLVVICALNIDNFVWAVLLKCMVFIAFSTNIWHAPTESGLRISGLHTSLKPSVCHVDTVCEHHVRHVPAVAIRPRQVSSYRFC